MVCPIKVNNQMTNVMHDKVKGIKIKHKTKYLQINTNIAPPNEGYNIPFC